MLPETLDHRSTAENQWLTELNPVQRYEFQNTWAQNDAKAKNQHFLGWTLVTTGLGLGASSILTWWLNQE